MFYLIAAASILIGVIVIFAVDLVLGALVVAFDLVSLGLDFYGFSWYL